MLQMAKIAKNFNRKAKIATLAVDESRGERI